MRFKQLNTSRRKLLDEHECCVLSRLQLHDLQLADRDPNGDVIQRMNYRLFTETQPADIPAAPPLEHESENAQSVQILRRITMEATVHPDDRKFFEPAELEAVVDEAKLVYSKDAFRHFDYIEGSEHQALVGFQTAAQEKADREHEKKRADRAAKNRRRALRAGYKTEDIAAGKVDPAEAAKALKEREKWAGVTRERKEEIRDRLRWGFYHAGGAVVAGEVCGRLFEFFGAGVLRSRLGSPSLARMAALCPTVASGLRAGYDKAALHDATCKLFALDAPYVELNRKVAGCIVVDLDSVLRIEEFRIQLLAILGPHRMPNLIVGRITPSGFLSRPHLIWILKNPVWTDPYWERVDPSTGVVTSGGDKRCKTKPIKKLHAVQRALTQLLLPLGADPSFHNILKPKNALSPFWTTVVANDDVWHELSDFESIPGWPRKVDEHSLAKAAATIRADAAGDLPAQTPSNLAWKTIGHLIEPRARTQLAVREDDFMAAAKAGVGTLAAWFDDSIRADVEAELGPSEALDRLLAKRCEFAARYCIERLAKPWKRKVRGRDRDVIDDCMSLKERQQQAFARSADHRSAVFKWNICKEMVVALKKYGAIDKTEFIKSLGTVGKSAAYKHWDDLCAELDLEFREGVYREKARPTTVKVITTSPALASFLASNSGVINTDSGCQLIRTVDSGAPDIDYPSSTAGPPGCQQHNHADRPAEACLSTVDRVRDPVVVSIV
ncbi:MAG: hypothetical protein J0H40_17250 [Rhizobiales bacterium]|nr:hypothetical protein [Hyphomicrobiales bacterium]